MEHYGHGLGVVAMESPRVSGVMSSLRLLQIAGHIIVIIGQFVILGALIRELRVQS